MLPMTLTHYLNIVDSIGRMCRPNAKGAIDQRLKPILERLAIDADSLATSLRRTGRMIGTAIGDSAARAQEAARRGTKWVVSALEVPTLAR